MIKKYGIDKLGFYIPRYKLEQDLLAESRGISKDKIKKGLGQISMSVIPPWEDVVTMGVCAAKQTLSEKELSTIDCVLFATETGVDFSKAASVIVHELLNLPSRARAVEIKQACYAGTFGLHTALAMLATGVHKNVLLICSDVARYGFNSPGESSQGAGAVALLLKQDPRLAVVNPKAAFMTRHVHDFWRPHGFSEAIVDGKFSCQMYLDMLGDVFEQYKELNPYKNLFSMCFHLPVPRLVEKAYQQMSCFMSEEQGSILSSQLQYSKVIGNCYTGSLYLGLISLLENTLINMTEKSLGMYSYGSGATCDFFDIEIQSTYQKVLQTQLHQNLIDSRIPLSVQEYEKYYQDYGLGGVKGEYGYCAFDGVENHQRKYSMRQELTSYQLEADSKEVESVTS